MKIGEKEWEALIDVMAEHYEPGKLIPHITLRNIFMLQQPNYDDFENQEEFLQAVNLQQFEYMTLVEKLRLDILEKHKLYLRNIKGDGYTFLSPEDQTDYAKQRTLDGIKKKMNRGWLIMKNVRQNSLDADKRRSNANEMAKLAQLQQMMSVLK